MVDQGDIPGLQLFRGAERGELTILEVAKAGGAH